MLLTVFVSRVILIRSRKFLCARFSQVHQHGGRSVHGRDKPQGLSGVNLLGCQARQYGRTPFNARLTRKTCHFIPAQRIDVLDKKYGPILRMMTKPACFNESDVLCCV